MAVTATFETGTNGNTVSAADAGSATPWDTVNIGAGTLTYDNAHAYDTLAAKIGADPNGVELSWSTAFGTQTDHYGRVYLYHTAAGNNQVLRAYSTGTMAVTILLYTDGLVYLLDSTGGIKGTSTNTYSVNQFIRVEYHCIHSTTVGQIEAKLFNSPDSASPTETITSTANLNTLASANDVRFGHCNGPVTQAAFWIDNIVANATSYPGPAAVPSVSTIPAASPRFIYLRRNK